MKNLDLNAYGVKEMNAAEMQKTEGGIAAAVAWLVIGILVAELLDRNAAQDFRDGQAAYHNMK